MPERILHQMWLQGSESLPIKYQNRSLWNSVCGSFEFILWDQETIADFMACEYPRYFEIWKYLTPEIKKCDFARYLILHHFGGVYADLDTTPHRCVFDLASDLGISHCDAIFCEESYELSVWKSGATKSSKFLNRPEIVVGNAVLLGRKGARIWIDFLEAAIRLRDQTVLESFSTWHLSRFLASRHESDFEVIDFRFLLAKIVDPDFSYTTHSYDGNWFDETRECAWEV